MSPVRLDRQRLQALPLFQGLDDAILDRLLAGSRAELVEARQVLVDSGATVQAVVVVLTGRVELATVTGDGDRVVFGPLGPGGVIGDAALLDEGAFALENGTFAVTATALEDCLVLFIPATAFRTTLERDLRFAGNVARMLARRLRMMVVRDAWMTILDVPVRLARFITWLADTEGIGEDGGASRGPAELTIRLSQERLGEIVGATRETINKHLREWARQGVLEHVGGRIQIRDLERLREFAQLNRELLAHASVAGGR
jgi:CRP/FNR family transcriptional regulator, cyclic AMP receptor protein